MRKIKLTRGKYALVDDEDFVSLNRLKWNVNKQGYARRSAYIGGKVVIILMHRVINSTPTGMITDHINRNKLDNRRINLRTVNATLSAINRNVFKNNISGYRGVGWHKGHKKWVARIRVDKKLIILGDFPNIQDALLARREGERLYFGYALPRV